MRRLCLLSVLLAALAAADGAEAAVSLPCPRYPDVRCETVSVPLDRSGSVPGTISLRVAVARNARASRPPVIALVGGPGQAGVIFADELRSELGVRDRTVVVLDQRGTGASGLLRCPAFERRLAERENAGAGDCGAALGPRRSFYASVDSAEDIEAVRVRLRAPKIAIYAVSYGTRVALDYMRAHPDHVERVILDSALPDGVPDAFSLDTLEAIPRVVRRVCASGCDGAGRHPVRDLERLTVRLRARPVRRVVHRDGRRKPVRIGVGDVYSLIVSGDLEPGLLRSVPPAVRAALGGRYGPLIDLKLRARRLEASGPVSQFSPAVFAATLCEESPVAWDRAADVATRTAQVLDAINAVPPAAVAPFDRTAALQGGLFPLCRDWPAPDRILPPPGPLPTGLPVLILSGELDLRTPLESQRALLESLPGSRMVVERGVGHAVLGSGGRCADGATIAFLEARPLPRCGLVG